MRPITAPAARSADTRRRRCFVGLVGLVCAAATPSIAQYAPESAPETVEAVHPAVTSVLANWRDAFGRNNWEALVSLYADNVLFYGSTPALRRGHAGVRAYFAALPPRTTAKVEFTQVVSEPIRPDVINVAALATFSTDAPLQSPVLRFTLILEREGQRWKIAAHHVSPFEAR